MTDTLHRMNLGGILDRAIQILGAKFALFAGLSIVPGLVGLAVQLASVHPKMGATPSGAQLALSAASYIVLFVFSVGNFFLQAVVTAANCLVASRIHVGEEITIRAAFGKFASKAGRLAWLSFLQGLYAGWPLIIAIPAAHVVESIGGSSYLQVPVLILGAVPCIALYCRYALAFPASAIENLSAHDAIERSISLSTGNRWKICWGFLLPTGVGAGFISGSNWLIESLKTGSPFLAGNPIAVAGFSGIVALLLGLVFTPLSPIVLTLLYYDQRIRREGYDIERMMEFAGLNAPAVLPAGDSPAATSQEEVHA